MMQGRPLLNLLAWQVTERRFRTRTTATQFASLSFDVSFQEIFSALSSGSTLLIVPADVRGDFGALAQFLGNCAAERVFMPPVVLQAFATTILSERLSAPGVQMVITAGEQLRITPEIREIFSRSPGSILANQYGPTETHVATSMELVGTPDLWEEAPPIGRPIANVRSYVLDERAMPVPIGVPGELWLGGECVALGYLNRPALTAERFIPDPFAARPGVRMYKTGDLVRWRADGNLEFLGRIDDQIKLRGYRIEPGEVEAVLCEHPVIRAAVVIAREDIPGDKRLVAYLVPDPRQGSLDDVELSRLLRQRLPEYMVPSAFVMLSELPVTLNGKVDRRALAPPEGVREGVATYRAPHTISEQRLAKIWADVLGLDRVGIDDNFFDLGGHSLQAAQVSSRASLAFRRNVPVRLLLQHRELGALARAVEELVPERRVAQQAESPKRFLSSARHVEHRPLLSLVATGEVGPVDAAAVGYLPDSMLRRSDVSKDEVIEEWYDALPTLSRVRDTCFGRVGSIVLPRFESQIYDDQTVLVDLLLNAIRLAGRLGARVVSLTGLIPSATEYGAAVVQALKDVTGTPAITTGHATTAAAVVMAATSLLEKTGRDIRRERVGFLGLGSVGSASLRLLIRHLPKPAEIVLCDVYGKRGLLELIHDQLRLLGFEGRINLLDSDGLVPNEMYAASLIVGATNVPDILDVRRLNPGTLVVDDSAPHCFDVVAAVDRMKNKRDILVIEGGSIRLPDPIQEVAYLPRAAGRALRDEYMRMHAGRDSFEITGCVLSALLSAGSPGLSTTIGPVEDDEVSAHHEALRTLRCGAGQPRCGDYGISDDIVSEFRSHYDVLANAASA
jgi:hypothetical protein